MKISQIAAMIFRQGSDQAIIAVVDSMSWNLPRLRAPYREWETLAGSKMIAVLIPILGPLTIGHSAEAAKAFYSPVIPGFHSDLSICRVGDNYCPFNGTFECFPGVSIGGYAAAMDKPTVFRWTSTGLGTPATLNTEPDKVQAPHEK